MKKFPVLIFIIILIVSVLPVAKGSDVQNGSFLDLVVETFENVKDLPPTQYRYNAKDDQGIGLDTIKIIQISERVYLGVYHSLIGGTFQVRLANSTDLLNWTYVRTIELGASQPTIAPVPNGAYIVAFEKEENASSHLKLHYYSNLSALIHGPSSFTIDIPRNLSETHEGTPNFYNITVVQNTLRACIGFHYDNITANADEVAVGWLTVPLDNPQDYIWYSKPQKEYNWKLRGDWDVKGNIGDRDYGQIFGRNFTLQEGCLGERNGHWAYWRIFLYDHLTNDFTMLNIKTHKGATSFGNPTFTFLKSPDGKHCIVVTYFLFSEGAACGEAGELIFYMEFETEKYTVRYESNNYSVYVTSNSSLPLDFDLYCAVYPYSYRGTNNPLNEENFKRQIQKVKEISFKGVVLHNVECFYDEEKLSWAIRLLKNENLSVMLHIDYFNRTYHFPNFTRDTYTNKEGFFNDAELNLFCDYVRNVSKIVRNYTNFKGYIVYFPFELDWFDRIDANYSERYARIINAIVEADNHHSIWSGVMLWSANSTELKGIYDKLPKDIPYIEGVAIQPYNTIVDNIEKNKIKELYEYWKQFGEVQIGEFGYWWEHANVSHGNATSEESKACMIREFLDYMKALRHKGFVCYFGLTDFPPENADFGIVYDNCTLKASGEAFKDWIEEDQKKFDFNETERGININVTGPDGSKGFLIAELPNILTQDLWKGNYTVLLDNKPLQFENWTSTINTYIYVTYTHSEHKLTIIPEYPSFLIILLTFTVGPLSCCLHSKRAQQNSKKQAHPVCPPN